MCAWLKNFNDGEVDCLVLDLEVRFLEVVFTFVLDEDLVTIVLHFCGYDVCYIHNNNIITSTNIYSLSRQVINFTRYNEVHNHSNRRDSSQLSLL